MCYKRRNAAEVTSMICDYQLQQNSTLKPEGINTSHR